MIRSVGRAGPLKVCGLVLYLLRYDLLAVLVVAAVMALNAATTSEGPQESYYDTHGVEFA